MLLKDAIMPIKQKPLRSLRGGSMQGKNNYMLQGGATEGAASSFNPAS